MQRFLITDQPIDPPNLEDSAAGASVTFEGRIRNHNEDRSVERLVYECYRELALSEGERILAEAINRFGVTDIRAIHRIGLLEIGETAIWLQALAAHRQAAFAACQWAMDEIKRQVPIWKHEHYTEGAPVWIVQDGEESSALHARQVILPEIGVGGQARLKDSRVLIVGVGGLGCPAATYLAAAGVGRITIIDPDQVEESNLNRQPLYSAADIGRSKVDVAADRLKGMAPRCQVESSQERVDIDRADAVVSGFDLVLDCTDDLTAKFALNDACVRHGVPLISASIHRWHGQLFVVDEGPCMRCLWKEQPPAGCVKGCEEEGILGSVAGFFGVLQANEGLKKLLGLPSSAQDALFLADLRDFSVMRIRRSRDSSCPACSSLPKAETRPGVDLPAPEAARLCDPICVDVRQDPREPLPDSMAELGDWQVLNDELKGQARPVILVCHRGVTSSRLAYSLRSQGWEQVFSLEGGVAAWGRP